jgi:glycosyltransferase involved in cell wall biosynthesis
MRIGIDARWMFRDVVNTQFALLATLLRQNARAPYDATFVLYTDQARDIHRQEQGGNVIVRCLKSLQARDARSHTSLIEDLWWFERAIPAALATDGITVFVSPYYRAPRASVPVINMVHDLSFLVLERELLPPHLQGRFKRAMLRRLHQFYCRHVASHTVAVSEYSKQCVVERLRMGPERVSVCYNGVDTELLAAAREQVDKDQRGPAASYLLYVGFNSPNKNLAGLLRGYALLPADLRAANPLVLHTRPGDEQQLIQAHGLTSVRYSREHLSRSGIASLVAGARALVLVSHDEGFGLPAIEAMAAGVPVVVSRGGALAEVTRGAMFEVDPRDPRSIASGISRAVHTGVSSELRARCRQIAARYSVQQAADRLMGVIAQRSLAA